MSGLEALGIVSNIFQVISFACETLALCKAVYRAQCGIAARALREEAAFLTSHHAKGSLRGTLQLAVKVNWRKKRLERLEGCLGSYQKTIETHLLGSICKQSDAIELAQRERFEKLDQWLQYFVSQYASGHTTLSELLEAENCSTRAHIARETSRTGKAVQSHITSEVNASQVSIIGHVDQKMESSNAKKGHLDGFLGNGRSVTPDSDNDTKSGSDNSDSNSDSDDSGGGKETGSFMSTDVADDEDLWDDFVNWLRSEDTLY